ncbi:MAG: MBL fold metallo-hydrolase, partial [Saprospiraceae bacterium]|nr:MBL fold metallo-hydrolase [Saprospiraceae bacterium]
VPVIACECEVCSSLDFRDKRLRSSVHVLTQDVSLVIDTGPDFRQQMLRERIKHLDAVLYTHEHKDHTAGMDDVRSFNFKQKMDIPIYARERVLNQLKKEFEYVFAEHKYPGVPQIEANTITDRPFDINNVTINPIEVLHYKLSVHGFRIGDFTYITDANSIPEASREKIIGSKVVVINALQREDHISHFTLSEAINLAQEIDADQTYFTHISHRLGTHKDVSSELPDKVNLAQDGLKVEI